MDTRFDSKKIENKWSKKWLEKGFFKSEVKSQKTPYTLIMPPPNLTGPLHLGHILQHTISDCLARFKRMQGYDVLWQPGVDHAGIQMQTTVEKKLKKEEGKTRQEIGRKKFLEYTWKCKEEWHQQQQEQMKKIGESADWDREIFTLDPGPVKAVKKEFFEFFKTEQIYFGSYQVNWCPRCETALMDIETEYETRQDKLYYIKYFTKDQKDFITVATVRPETMFADSAVAVNPDDKRFAKFSGKEVVIPLINKAIRVITDKAVEKDFGTGALKVTPAHSYDDYEIGKRHSLDMPMVITREGRLDAESELVPEFLKGDKIVNARPKLVEKLDKDGFIEKVEDYEHSVQVCERCKHNIEPLISQEWFVGMKELSNKAIEVLESDKIEFKPTRYKQATIDWLKDIKDWCISRNLWWGHSIPVYYCETCKADWGKAFGELQNKKVWAREDMPGVICSLADLTTCPHCSGAVKQEEKVLDTWFSSGLWPMSTLGWPKETAELEKYYPTNLMVTAPEILHLWVSRMIMLGLHFKKDVPFKTVFLHGTLRDQKGQKMSKSLGNGVDPIEMIDKYSADALRFALAEMAYPGRDIRMSKRAMEDKIRVARNFTTKIWNISRLILSNVSDDVEITAPDPKNLGLAESWVLHRLAEAVESVGLNLEKNQVARAATSVYDFVWRDLADWYLEISKKDLYGENDEKKAQVATTLLFVLKTILTLIHPFMPFVSEEINSAISTRELVVSNWPSDLDRYENPKTDKLIGDLQDRINKLRSGDNSVKPPEEEEVRDIFNFLSKK